MPALLAAMLVTASAAANPFATFSFATNLAYFGGELQADGETVGWLYNTPYCSPYYNETQSPWGPVLPAYYCELLETTEVQAILEVRHLSSSTLACDDPKTGYTAAYAECSEVPAEEGWWQATTQHIVLGSSIPVYCYAPSFPAVYPEYCWPNGELNPYDWGDGEGIALEPTTDEAYVDL